MRGSKVFSIKDLILHIVSCNIRPAIPVLLHSYNDSLKVTVLLITLSY